MQIQASFKILYYTVKKCSELKNFVCQGIAGDGQVKAK